MKQRVNKVYTKDFDDNIIGTDVDVILERWIDGEKEIINIPAQIFALQAEEYCQQGRGRLNGDIEESYQLARDYMPGSEIHPGLGLFRTQIERALIDNLYSPSAEKFKTEVLCRARPFAINTARGNSMDTIKYGILELNDLFLSDEEKKQQLAAIRERFLLGQKYRNTQVLRRYFDSNVYLPVNNTELMKLLAIAPSSSTGVKKTIAQDRYISQYLPRYIDFSAEQKISLGFSDDSVTNISAMLRYFLEKNNLDQPPYSKFTYRLYYTGKNINSFEEILKQDLFDIFSQDRIADSFVFEKQKSKSDLDEYDIVKISLT